MSTTSPLERHTAAQGRRAALDAMLEKPFQDGVIKLAKYHGYTLIYHTHDSRRSAPGFPDLVMINPVSGRVLFRELKRNKGRVTGEQQAWLDGLVTVGLDAGVWRPNDLDDGTILRELHL